jgi:adenylate cyclase
VASIVGRFLGRIIQHFPDPQMELDYLTEQRSRQAKFTKMLCRIIGWAILAFVVSSFVFLQGDALKTVGFTQIYFIPVLLGYAWAVDRPSYITSKWIDVFFFILIQPGMYVTNIEMVASGVNGWDLTSHFCYSLLLAMAAGCLVFSAAVSAYLFLVIASVGYYAGLLFYHMAQGGALGAEITTGHIGYSLNSYCTFVAVLFYLNWTMDDKARRLFKLRLDLDIEKAKSERLLDNVLPPVIAQRLREGEEVADDFDGVSIIFADIVGFTRLSEKLGPRKTVEMLSLFFNRADQAAERFGMEKIKTIGDCYMAVSGALTKPECPQKAALEFGAFLVREAHVIGRELGLDLKVSVGINTGEVVGGVIGTERLSYDYWGDSINVAARLQGLADADCITVSEDIYLATRDSYDFHPPRTAHLKNLGERKVYDVDLKLELVAA